VPRVSVIIPAYNAELYVREAIDSVLGQTFIDLEIIVVDDGSTDNTANIVGRVSDHRVRLICQGNKGVSSARNAGINNSAGQYLQFLDSDDLILPGKLAAQVPLLDADPDVGLVYSSFRYFYDDRCDLAPPPWLRPPSDDPYRELVAGSMFPCHAALLRRSAVTALGRFDEELDSGEDWDLWLRLARTGARFLFHSDLLALYRQHPGSITTCAATWRHGHVQVMENLRKRAQDEAELERIDWYYYASRNYVQWALALVLEGEQTRGCAALDTAYSLHAALGYPPRALARLIAEYALACDSRREGGGGRDGADFLDTIALAFPRAYSPWGVLRESRSLYWLARAHQAHERRAGSDVRRCVWEALAHAGLAHINAGTVSILVQSAIGHENWRRLRAAWHYPPGRERKGPT
jgi:glycosyltransferase involved in cell wall biosynthesis